MPIPILVVDDEADLELLVRHRFRARIAAAEIEVTFARDGAEALAILAERTDIGLIVTDINMPVMDGLTLLENIRALPRITRTIIVSAYDDLENIRFAMNRGACDFLTKPIDFADFETTVDKGLRDLAALVDGEAARRHLTELEYELDVAARIQNSILPEIITGRPEFEIGANMLPARQVSGDFYDFFLLDSNRLGVAIGDVSGKGIPAALFMAVSRTLLRATALHGASPRDCLAHMNRVLLAQSNGEVFLTVLYGILDLTTGAFEFSAGAHPPPYLIRRDREGMYLRDPRGTMVGLLEEAEFQAGSVTLEPGETLFFYTDGITEAESAEAGFFTQARLTQTLCGQGDKCAPRLVAEVIDRLEKFTGGGDRADDVTVLAVRYRPAQN